MMWYVFWGWVGRALYLIFRPAIFIIVRISPPRTRVLIICDNKILLVKDWLGNGKWKLPGGGMHSNEDPAVCAVREIKEEVGIIARSNQLIALSSYEPKGKSKIHYCFLLHLDNLPEIQLQKLEIFKYQWVLISQLDSFDLSDSTRDIVSYL